MANFKADEVRLFLLPFLHEWSCPVLALQVDRWRVALQKPPLSKGLTRLLVEETRGFRCWFGVETEAAAQARKATGMQDMLKDPDNPSHLVRYHFCW